MSPASEAHDPERWSERRVTDPASDGGIGEAFRRDRHAVDLGDAALARIGRVVMAGGRRGGQFFRLRTALLAALALVASGGVVAAARLALQAGAREPQSLILNGPGTASLTVRHRRRLTLVGPGKLQVNPGVAAPGAEVALESGQLIVEPGSGPALAVKAGDDLVTVPATASAQIHAARSGQPARVEVLSGRVQLARDGTAPVTVTPVPPAPPAPIATSAPVESAPAIAPAFPSSPGPARGSVGAAPPRAIATAEPGPRRTAKAKAAPAAPADPASAAEARSLASAFQKLRGAHDAVAALVALDDYQRAYPAGWLRGEAALARAEALLALGRESEALAALDAATFSGAVLTRDVRLARGQLLTRVGRCPDAVADFDGVLRAGAADAAGEQALAGRAGCQLRAGQSARAYEDLRRYLSLFPDGPYAAQARRWLRDAR